MSSAPKSKGGAGKLRENKNDTCDALSGQRTVYWVGRAPCIECAGLTVTPGPLSPPISPSLLVNQPKTPVHVYSQCEWKRGTFPILWTQWKLWDDNPSLTPSAKLTVQQAPSAWALLKVTGHAVFWCFYIGLSGPLILYLKSLSRNSASVHNYSHYKQSHNDLSSRRCLDVCSFKCKWGGEGRQHALMFTMDVSHGS